MLLCDSPHIKKLFEILELFLKGEEMKYSILIILLVGSLFADEKLLQSALYYGLKPVPKDLKSLREELNMKERGTLTYKSCLRQKTIF